MYFAPGVDYWRLLFDQLKSVDVRLQYLHHRVGYVDSDDDGVLNLIHRGWV